MEKVLYTLHCVTRLKMIETARILQTLSRPLWVKKKKLQQHELVITASIIIQSAARQSRARPSIVTIPRRFVYIPTTVLHSTKFAAAQFFSRGARARAHKKRVVEMKKPRRN